MGSMALYTVAVRTVSTFNLLMCQFSGRNIQKEAKLLDLTTHGHWPVPTEVEKEYPSLSPKISAAQICNPILASVIAVHSTFTTPSLSQSDISHPRWLQLAIRFPSRFMPVCYLLC